MFTGASYFEFVDVSGLEETTNRLSKNDWLGRFFVAEDNKCDAGVSRSLCSQRQHLPLVAYLPQLHRNLITQEYSEK